MSLYTPWRDEWSDLHARTRGRDADVGAIVDGARQLVAGARPLPLFFFGPCGVGKSHVVTDGLGLVKRELENAGLAVVSLSEDLPELGDADALWARMVGGARAGWAAWDRPTTPTPRRGVCVVEGFDRQLVALGAEGRKRLRGLLDAHPVWVVATGARLVPALTNKDEAFYGAFRTIPLHALDPADAEALVDHEAGDEVELDPHWPARRTAIVLLAGGNPRALVALGRAVRAAPAQQVAQRLLAVLDEFTPHYQLRFRDLSPQEQQLIDLLTRAPRQLGPSEVSLILGSSPSSWSTCANRLGDEGVLRIRHEGRHAWYRIAEPLFRYWLEFRSASSWIDTRVAWLGELLEHVLGPDELVDTWTDSDDEVLGRAALRAVKRKPQARQAAWAKRLPEVQAALTGGDSAAVAHAVRSIAEVVPTARDAWTLVRQLALFGHPGTGRILAPALREHGADTLATLVASDGDAGELRHLLVELGRRRTWHAIGEAGPADWRGLVTYVDAAGGRIDPRGRAWVLGTEERRVLREAPFLRARLARYGRRPSDPPVLGEADLAAAALEPTTPDLAEILWVAVAKRLHAATGRMLLLVKQAPEPRLPWCPWPGSRLPELDSDLLADAIVRNPTVLGLTWLGATLEVRDAAFAPLWEHPSMRRLRAVGALQSGLQLAFTPVALACRPRYEQLRATLSDPSWEPLFTRVDVLVQQLAEAERGPLHPELARIHDVVRRS